MIRTTIFALLAGTAMATVTFAQQAADTTAPEMSSEATAPETTRGEAQTPQRRNRLMRLDTDGNGEISREEAEAAMQNPMAAADLNGDGTITREEAVGFATAQATERANAMFDRMSDGGEGVSVADLPQRRGPDMGRMFERLDTDGNGSISAEEMQAMRGERRGEGRDRGHGRMERDHGRKGHGEGRMTMRQFERMHDRAHGRMDGEGRQGRMMPGQGSDQVDTQPSTDTQPAQDN